MVQKNNLTATELIRVVTSPKVELYPCTNCKFFVGAKQDKELIGFGKCQKHNILTQTNGTCSQFKQKEMRLFAWIATKIRR